MRAKVFRIMSNSDNLLSADVIAEALLKQLTRKSYHPTSFFAVIEPSKEEVNCKQDREL